MLLDREKMLTQIEENNQIANELYSKYEVKRGLRDDQG